MNWEPISSGYEHYLRDESPLQGHARMICFPESPEEAAQAMAEAWSQGKTLTIQGGNTGLRGGAVPLGGWVMNLSRLTSIGPVRPQSDGTARITAGAGVTLQALQQKCGAEGYRFAPNPTEDTATLGGLFATDGEGPDCLAFGKTADHVTGVEWISPQGTVKRITGPGIRQLAGTEGGCGAAAELELRLLPKAGDLWGIVFFFREENQAIALGKALECWRKDQKNAVLTTAEFYNRGTLELLDQGRANPLLQRIPAFPLDGDCAVYVELEGKTQEATIEALTELLDLNQACGGREQDSWAENGVDGVEKFRNLRHAIVSILSQQGLPEGDFSGAPEQFPEFLQAFRAIAGADQPVLYGHLLGCSFAAAADESVLTEFARFVRRSGGSLGTLYGRGKSDKPWMRNDEDL